MKHPWVFALLLLAAACAGGGGIPNPAAQQAIQATLTADAARLAPSPTPEAPASGSTPAAPPPTAIANTPAPLGAELCAHDLLFLDDLTVPDGTVFAPGAAIDKRWQVQNTGECAWGPNFRIVLVEGDALGAPAELALFPALPGREGLVRALMTAPAAPGNYSGTWSAQDPQGNQFGNKMWVRITVAGE